MSDEQNKAGFSTGNPNRAKGRLIIHSLSGDTQEFAFTTAKRKDRTPRTYDRGDRRFARRLKAKPDELNTPEDVEFRARRRAAYFVVDQFIIMMLFLKVEKLKAQYNELEKLTLALAKERMGTEKENVLSIGQKQTDFGESIKGLVDGFYGFCEELKLPAPLILALHQQTKNVTPDIQAYKKMKPTALSERRQQDSKNLFLKMWKDFKEAGLPAKVKRTKPVKATVQTGGQE